MAAVLGLIVAACGPGAATARAGLLLLSSTNTVEIEQGSSGLIEG